MIRTDNSVQSSNTPSLDTMARERGNKLEGMQRGMIFRTYYADDALNPTKNSQNPQVVYDVILISGPMQGQILPLCRTASSLGGQHNYEEIIYRKASKPFSGPGRTPFNQQDGDVVLIDCVDGNLGSAMIVGSASHPLDKTNTGAKKADGPRWLREYNGVKQSIDKDGMFILTRKGGKYDATKDYFTPEAAGNEAQLKLEKNKFTASAKSESVSMVMDGESKKITLTTPSGVTVVIDGGSNKITITGKSGSAAIEVDGSSGKLTLTGDMIDIGMSASSLSLLGTEFMAWAQSHTHMVPQAPAGMLPSQPPIVPPPQSTISGTVKIQK